MPFYVPNWVLRLPFHAFNPPFFVGSEKNPTASSEQRSLLSGIIT